MSQQGPLTVTTSGGSVVETITGNSGGAVGPDAAFNIDFVGNNTSGINIVGVPASNLLTVVGIASTTTQQGTVSLATNAETIAGVVSTKAVTPSSLAAKLGTQTNHGLPIGSGSSSAFTWTAAPTDGQVLIGSTGVDPVLSTLTPGAGVSITNGAGSITIGLTGGGVGIDSLTVDAFTGPGTNPVVPDGAGNVTITGAQVAAGTVGANVIRTDSLSANAYTIEIQRSTAVAGSNSVNNGVSHFDSDVFSVDANGFVTASGTGLLQTLTGNSGGAIAPTAGNINTVGSGSITIAGAGSTLTTQLTGLTNHNVLVGAGTDTITNVAPSATAGVPLVSQGAAADPAFGTAVVAGGGTGATSFNINGVVISNTTTTGALSALTLTSGQVVIGGTTTPAAATLTPGSGISITNGNNSITIASTGGGSAWVDVTGTTQTIAASTGYLSNNAGTVTFTLPASGTFGDVFRIVGRQGAWVLAQNANQQVLFGANSTTVGVGGSLASTNAGDCIECLATNTSASTVWRVMSSVGNITVT